MVPNGWKQLTLSEITKEKISYGIVQAGPHVDNGIPYIKSSDVGGDIDVESLQRTAPDIHYKYRRSAVHPRDIVFSLRGNIGRTSIVPDNLVEANLTQGTARISVDKNHDTRFVYYKLASNSIMNRINALSKGSTFKEISLEELRKVKLAFPSLPEQRKIAKILSTWDQAIATTERLIATSQQQKKALMQQLLTGKKRLVNPETGKVFEGNWERHSLSHLAYIDKKSLSNKTPDDYEFKYISLSDVTLGTISSNLEVHKYATAPSRARRILQNGDILLSTVRPNLKGFAKVSEKYAECIASTGFSILTPKRGASGDYIYQYIFSSHITGQIDSLVVGSNYPAINSSDVAGLKVYCPSYDEQQKIASVLTAADQEIEQLEAKLAHLKDEKKALMQQLLTGKRRVKVDATEVA